MLKREDGHFTAEQLYENAIVVYSPGKKYFCHIVAQDIGGLSEEEKQRAAKN